MLLRGLVVSDQPEEFESKRGHQKVQRLSVVDQDVSGARLSHMLQYTLNEAEKLEHAGKLADKIVNFAVTTIEKSPMGVMQFRGRILSVEGVKK